VSSKMLKILKLVYHLSPVPPSTETPHISTMQARTAHQVLMQNPQVPKDSPSNVVALSKMLSHTTTHHSLNHLQLTNQMLTTKLH